MQFEDAAGAYEHFADEFLRRRSDIGENTVRAWAGHLPDNSDLLELGCGGGLPVTRTLVAAGHRVSAIDASPSLLETFRTRFPTVDVRCERVQDSTFFDRQFDAIVAVGLIFLLPAAEQHDMIERIARHLRPGGGLLMTAPVETGEWTDVVTGMRCESLGEQAYREALKSAGFADPHCLTDSGPNNYYATTLSASSDKP
ncbi:MAG: methyltransferase domain-containing protein [Pseudomonadota bacterium]